MEVFLKDLRYGIRILAKSPGYSLIAVMTLALGIGANTAIFSVVNAVLLKPLPFAEPERLVSVMETHPELPRLEVATPDFKDWRDQAESFETMAALSSKGSHNLVLLDQGEPEQLVGTCVTQNLFPMLGINPVLGRNFLPEEDQSGSGHVVILSHSVWQRRFASDPNIVNRSINLGGESYTVIGIAPAAQFPFDTDLWLPFSNLRPAEQNNRIYHTLQVVARLKSGVNIEQARAEMEAISQRLQQAFPATNKTIGATVGGLQEQYVGKLRPALLVLLGAVGLVLLIACANVSNLLLARAMRREKEVAIRSALGATRGRLVKQMLTESVLLALIGAGCGLLFAQWGIAVMRSALPDFSTEQIPGLINAGLDPGVLTFTLVIATVTGLMFGLIPAYRLSRVNLNETLKQGGRGSGSRRRGLSAALVIVEVALAMIVIVNSGLLVRSFRELMRVDPGFRTDHLLTSRVSASPTRYQDYEKLKAFYRDVSDRVEKIPGVDGVTTINDFRLGTSNDKTRFAVEGEPSPEAGRFPVAQIRNIAHNYFDVMGIRIEGGRAFTESDVTQNRNVMMINETMARRYFPNQDPVGRKILLGVMSSQPTAIEIVGVAADVKDLGIDSTVEPEIYTAGFRNEQMLMIRTSGEPSLLAGAVRQAVLSVDREQPISQIRSMDDALASSLARRRFSTLLLGMFAGLALVLASVGIYGVIAWSVTQRTSEIGLRMALGAKSGDIMRMILSQGLRPAVAGLLVGTAAAYAASEAISSLLFGVTRSDPMTFAAIPLLIVCVSALSCYLPARRAAKVDPLVALRYE